MSAVIRPVIRPDRLVDLRWGDYAPRVLIRFVLGIALVFAAASTGLAEPERKERLPKDAQAAESAFARRLKALMDKPGLLVTVHLEGPPAAPRARFGTTLISGQRRGIYTPPVLEPQNMMRVIRTHMPDLERCYAKQLNQDPKWEEHLILDLAIRRTGRVSEVSVAPGRIRRDVIGTCLIRTVPRWRFPEFTGETADGITQEVVTASFPFSFAPSSTD